MREINSLRELPLGEWVELPVAKLVEFGAYLLCQETEILLPKKYLPEGIRENDTVGVFLYTDSEDRSIATTLRPAALLGECAPMRVVDTAPFGAFVDIGLEKDLLIPKKEIPGRVDVGETRIVRLLKDKQTGRLYGSMKIESSLKPAPFYLKKGKPVRVMGYAASPLGISVVVDDTYRGMVFHSDIFNAFSVGSEATGYIKQVRKDGKIDIALRPLGEGKAAVEGDDLLAALQESGGFLPFHYDSDPEAIKSVLGMSKKGFKRAVTALLAEDKITLDPQEGIRLK